MKFFPTLSVLLHQPPQSKDGICGALFWHKTILLPIKSKYSFHKSHLGLLLTHMAI